MEARIIQLLINMSPFTIEEEGSALLLTNNGVITHYRYDSAGQLVETVSGNTVGLEILLLEMELADRL